MGIFSNAQGQLTPQYVGRVRSGVGGGGWLVTRLGVVGDVQYWGWKPRIEGVVKCT